MPKPETCYITQNLQAITGSESVVYKAQELACAAHERAGEPILDRSQPLDPTIIIDYVGDGTPPAELPVNYILAYDALVKAIYGFSATR